MTEDRALFPFTAIVGQERLKLALLVISVDPSIGGLLVRGERGTGKSTAARALAELLPEMEVVADCPFSCNPHDEEEMCSSCLSRWRRGEPLPVARRPMRFVTLPLNASEDRLVGTLDLEKAMREGVKDFEPGILAAANRAVLYVDEVNLLEDHLVDLLLDVAAMGVNVVEREGISFAHPARFILVGTMNPEEGELRPQLLDRFGLCVEITGLPDLEDRMAVVTRRLAYEADPEGFAKKWEAEQERLRQSIISAQARLSRVTYSEGMLRLISLICLDQGVDGHRADIFMLKAAQTLAAYHGREEVTLKDVREAALLVLPHRRRRQPFGETRLDQEKLEESFRKFKEEYPEPLPPQASPPPEPQASSQEGPARVGEVVTPPGEPYQLGPLELPHDRQVQKAPGSRTRAKSEDQRGRYVRASLHRPRVPDLALDATLRAAAPFQTLRARGNLALAITDPDLRYKVRERKIGRHILFVLDASGSMGAQERMRETKAAILSLLLDAYQRRERVGLVVFRGEQAVVALPFTHSIEVAQRRLRDLPTGGKTPLPHGLALALEMLKKEKAKYPQDAFLLVLISDGKANISLTGRPPVSEAKELAAEIRALGVHALILDTERYWHEEGCLAALSDLLGGKRYSLEQLRAGEVVTRIGEVLGI